VCVHLKAGSVYDRWLTQGEIVLLLAIAAARRAHPYVELDWVEDVLSRVKDCETRLAQFLTEYDTDVILGRDVPAWLYNAHDMRISLRHLYRKIPSFAVGRQYRRTDVLKTIGVKSA
jgi:hypothetical protein